MFVNVNMNMVKVVPQARSARRMRCECSQHLLLLWQYVNKCSCNVYSTSVCTQTT